VQSPMPDYPAEQRRRDLPIRCKRQNAMSCKLALSAEHLQCGPDLRSAHLWRLHPIQRAAGIIAFVARGCMRIAVAIRLSPHRTARGTLKLKRCA
jgi:hypothetical protein